MIKTETLQSQNASIGLVAWPRSIEGRGTRDGGFDLGFSLIELMVVVAIIAILGTIAIPNFKYYTRTAKVAGLRANLGALYKAEQTYFAEYSSYSSRLDAIGYWPVGNFEANIGFYDDLAAPSPAFQGTPGCNAICSGGCSNIAWSCTAVAMATNLDSGGAITAKTFHVEAHWHYEGSPGNYNFVTVHMTDDKTQWLTDGSNH